MKISFTKIQSVVTVGAIACSFLFALCVAPTASHAALIQKSGTTTTGLVGWWPLDEGTSTIAGDFSANKNSGTITNTFVWSSGKRGRAVQFDGSTSYIISNNPVNFVSNYSVTFWVYLNSIAAYGLFSNSPIAPPVLTGSGNSNNIYINPNGTVGYFVFDGSGKNLTSTTTLRAGRWYQVSVTHDATNSIRRLYIDGRLEHQDSFLNIQSFSKVIFSFSRSDGGYYTTPLGLINGKMDDVRIYNQALSATDVSALYRAGETVRKVADKTGLVGYWPMDEGTSTLVSSFSGIENSGTLSNFSFPATITSGWTSVGKKGGALIFDGIDDYFNINQPAVQTTPNLFTVSGWIYPDNQYARFITPNANGLDNWIGYDATNQRLEVFITEIADVNNRSVATSFGSVPLNQWTHWSVSINDKNIKIHINGVLLSDTTEVINIGGWSGGWIIGQRGTSAQWLKGKLDDLRVYNRVLSSQEVNTIYRSNQTKVNAPQDTKLTNGLVGYWTFNGKDVGTTIADVSGQNNPAYVIGSATSTALGIGKVGQGFKLDGVNTYAQIANASVLDFSGPITLSAWIKTSATNDYAGIIQKSNSATQGYQLGFSTAASGQIRCDLFNGVSYTGPSGGPSVLDGEWHHVACTYDGTTQVIYVDGIARSTGTVGSGYVVPSGLPVTIGFDRCCGPGRKFNGIIDEARIYNRGLTAAEIKRLYLMGK